MDWWKDIIEEYKDEGEKGALKLNFRKHKEKVDDDGVNQVIAGMDKPQCDKVRCINLFECSQITDAALTTIGEHCRHLQKPDLYGCVGVTDEGITAVLRNNPMIKVLYFTYCKKVTSASIDAVIEHCPDIEKLWAYDVGLTSLPDNIGHLSKLKELNIRNNNITALPLSIGNLPEDCKLYFDNNPITNVPFSAIRKGPAAIKRFFELKEKEGAAQSNQFKMALLGTGEAGKTSPLNALMNKPRNANASEINGIVHPNVESKKPLVMMSARFNKDKYEDMSRALASELQKKGVNIYMVDAGVGTTFGDKTIYGLFNMVAMICFCSPNYGQKTEAKYSSFYELKYAYDNDIPLVPIKMCDVWPPVPPKDHKGGMLGPAQNGFVFSKDLVYKDWSERTWDAVKCAEEIKNALQKMGKCPMILEH